MEENTSLNTAIAVAVTLIGTGIYLRRRYGSVSDMWSAAMARTFRIDRSAVFKGALVFTMALWLAAWVFTTPEQRADLKKAFYESSPFAPMMKVIDPKAN